MNNRRNHVDQRGADWSLAKAQMRPGDFELRRDSRHLFSNVVEIYGDAGAANIPKSFRRAASLVETPTYDVPKLWRLELSFAGQNPAGGAPYPMGPFMPVGGPETRIIVRSSPDRDKSVSEETITLAGNGNTFGPAGSALPSFFPTRLVVGVQVGVRVETGQGIGTGTLRPLVVQATLVEVTGTDRDAYGNATISRFAQSDVSALFLAPNGRRRQMFIQNYGTSTLYVALAPSSVAAGAAAAFSFLLTPGSVYESLRDCWQGYVSGVWAAVGGVGDGATVTEGY